MATSASQRLDNIRNQGEKTLRSVGKAAEKEIHDAAKSTRRQARRFMKRAGKVEDQASGYIKDNPYTSLGLAAGVGILAGALLARR